MLRGSGPAHQGGPDVGVVDGDVGQADRRASVPLRTAVKGYAAMHDLFRTSVQGTARPYLKWLAGEDDERALLRHALQ